MGNDAAPTRPERIRVSSISKTISAQKKGVPGKHAFEWG
jgi:hypothetical protein